MSRHHNPDGATVVQGNIIMGLSSALVEEATVKDGALAALNFDAYRQRGLRAYGAAVAPAAAAAGVRRANKMHHKARRSSSFSVPPW